MACEDPLYAAQNPAECLVAAGGDLAASAAASSIDRLLGVLADAMIETQKLVMSFWMDVPSANPLTTPYTSGGGLSSVPQAPELTSALVTSRNSLAWLMAIIAVFGIIAAAVRAAVTNRASDLVPIARMLFTLIAVSLFGTTAVWVGIQLSDAYAPWILQQARPGVDLTGESFIKREWIIQAGLVSGGLNVLVGILAGFAQIVFMFFRGALLLLMLAVWPTVAAGTATESGMSTFRKMNAWIIALLLYKPIAANVYALGLLVYARDSELGTAGDLMSLLLGTTLLVLAAISLPMLVRFVMPPAGVGLSSAFSGGAVVGGIATGAITVAALGSGIGAPAAAGAAGSSSRLVGGFQPAMAASGAAGGTRGGGAASGGGAGPGGAPPRGPGGAGPGGGLPGPGSGGGGAGGGPATSGPAESGGSGGGTPSEASGPTERDGSTGPAAGATDGSGREPGAGAARSGGAAAGSAGGRDDGAAAGGTAGRRMVGAGHAGTAAASPVTGSSTPTGAAAAHGRPMAGQSRAGAGAAVPGSAPTASGPGSGPGSDAPVPGPAAAGSTRDRARLGGAFLPGMGRASATGSGGGDRWDEEEQR